MNPALFSLISEFCSSIIETNSVNILLLILLLIYVTNTVLKERLNNRQNKILRTAKQLHYDSVFTLKQLTYMHQVFKNSLLYLEARRTVFSKKKIQVINKHYFSSKKLLRKFFLTNRSFIYNFQVRTVFLIKKYYVFLFVYLILRRILTQKKNYFYKKNYIFNRKI